MDEQAKVLSQEELAKLWDEAGADEAPPAAAQESDAEHPGEQAVADEATADASEEATEDPYAGLPQIVVDELKGLRSMLEQTQQQLRNASGHIGGLTSQMKELREASKAAKAAGASGPSDGELQAAQGSASKMAKLKEDYPDFASALDDVLQERLAGLQRPAQEPAQQPQNVVTERQFEAYRREQTVEARHPGWRDRVQTPAFAGWLQSQQREVQMLASSDDPRDAIRLLDLEASARKSADKNRRLDAAAAIPAGRSAGIARGKPVEQMTKAEYWQFLDEQKRVAQ